MNGAEVQCHYAEVLTWSVPGPFVQRLPKIRDEEGKHLPAAAIRSNPSQWLQGPHRSQELIITHICIQTISVVFFTPLHTIFSLGGDLFGEFFSGPFGDFFFQIPVFAFNLQHLGAITLHFAWYLHDLGSKICQITSDFHRVVLICVVFAAFRS